MNVALIPVRGGSKSIPLKNIKDLCGKPLVYWTAQAASKCKDIDKVYVFTDSDKIKKVVESFNLPKVSVIPRSKESASDTASTEYALLEFAQNYDFDNITLIQATSPLLTEKDLENGFKLFSQEDCDSVISVVKQYRFIWEEINNNVKSVNYDVFNRPRRQDFNGFLMENGAFYITSKKNLLESKNRVSGRIKAYEMPEETAYEIDEPNDWIIVEQLMKKRQKKTNLPKIKMLLTDCDGCLTDGGMYYSEFGDELKKFNTKDGMAFSILHDNGIITGIITSENVELNRRRAEKMHLNEIHMNVKDKLKIAKELSEKYKISLNEILYVGDDINDLSLLKEVGFSCCPKDAVLPVRETVDYIANSCGGQGVIREIVDVILGN